MAYNVLHNKVGGKTKKIHKTMATSEIYGTI